MKKSAPYNIIRSVRFVRFTQRTPKAAHLLLPMILTITLTFMTTGCENEEGTPTEPTDPTAASSPEAPTPPPSEGWISLFNGQDLDGWIPKFAGFELGENHKNTFRVEDGILKVSYDEYEKFDGEFGHLFYKAPFSHYLLRIEYRFVGEQTPGGPSWGFRNSGVMIHSQPPESMGLEQSFPVSIEAQFLGGAGTEERPTANLCTPGTNVVIGGELVTQHCTNSTSATYHDDQWVTVEIEVNGAGTVKHIIDGQTVMEYERPQLDPSDPDAQKLIEEGRLLLEQGYVALQAESHPLEFRKVMLKALK